MVFLTLLALICQASSQPQAANTQTYKVARVIDAETVTLADTAQTKIRLLGTDATGIFPQEAKSFLESLVAKDTVAVQIVGTADTQGRVPAYLHRTSDFLFINLYMVQQGYAFASQDRSFEKFRQFQLAERDAERNRLGLWASSTYSKSSGTSEPSHGHKPHFVAGQETTIAEHTDVTLNDPKTGATWKAVAAVTNWIWFDDYAKAVSAVDDDGVQELFHRGHLLFLKPGTKVKVLSTRDVLSQEQYGVYVTLVEIRVLDGQWKGQSAYVMTGYLESKD